MKILLLLLFSATLWAQMPSFSRQLSQDGKKVMVYDPGFFVHRGDTSKEVENTKQALDSAFTHGADGVEYDIRKSSNGTYWLMHDATVDRTTDGSGSISALSDATLAGLLTDIAGKPARAIPRWSTVLDDYDGSYFLLYTEYKSVTVSQTVDSINTYDLKDYNIFLAPSPQIYSVPDSMNVSWTLSFSKDSLDSAEVRGYDYFHTSGFNLANPDTFLASHEAGLKISSRQLASDPNQFSTVLRGKREHHGSIFLIDGQSSGAIDSVVKNYSSNRLLRYGAVVTVSSGSAVGVPYYRDCGTQWQATSAASETVFVDLAASKEVPAIEIYFVKGSNAIWDYKIEYSSDDVTYSEIFPETNNNAAIVSLAIIGYGKRNRYWRVIFTDRVSGSGNVRACGLKFYAPGWRGQFRDVLVRDAEVRY